MGTLPVAMPVGSPAVSGGVAVAVAVAIEVAVATRLNSLAVDMVAVGVINVSAFSTPVDVIMGKLESARTFSLSNVVRNKIEPITIKLTAASPIHFHPTGDGGGVLSDCETDSDVGCGFTKDIGLLPL